MQGRFRGKLIVVLNDNTMSISRNVGVYRPLSGKQSDKSGLPQGKRDVESVLWKIPRCRRAPVTAVLLRPRVPLNI